MRSVVVSGRFTYELATGPTVKNAGSDMAKTNCEMRIRKAHDDGRVLVCIAIVEMLMRVCVVTKLPLLPEARVQR